MEQRLISMHQVTDRDAGALGDPACRTLGSVRCGLPLGLPMICGDARHREDRAPDSEVIAGGTPSHDVWLIRKGLLRLQRYAYDGRRQILSLFLPGEIVGFEGEFRDGVSVETATQCGLCRIDRRKFDRMVDQNDTLRADLFRQKQDQLDRLHWLTWSLGALGPEERLCAFLALSTKFMPYQPLSDGTGILTVQLPRKDIADLLATTVESTSRIVHKLSRTGVIEIKDPSHFRLLDLPRLIALGQIEGLFDRMTGGLAKGASHLEHLVVMGSDSPVCFCGR
jgi:CRP/FNR family transcriptional regulator